MSENKSETSSGAAGSPPSGFRGANIGSIMPSQAPPTTPPVTTAGADRPLDAHPMAANRGVASANPPEGGRDESIPVHSGNSHMLLGHPKPEALPDTNNQEEVTGAQADEAKRRTARFRDNAETDASIGGPGTEHPNAGLTRTVGTPESAATPIEQIGNTVIVPEDNVDTGRPEFEPGKPKPRTDIDADPHEVTSPGFQGLDQVNPLPITPLNTVQHRGNPNEPRVVGVTAVGDVHAVGSKSDEARALRGDAPEKSETDEDPDDHGHIMRGKLPEDFPGRAALDGTQNATYARVRKLIATDNLTKIEGIGEITAGKIEEAMKE